MTTLIRPGQRVRVHVNLHLRRLAVCDPRTTRVITYVEDLVLTDVQFRVQPRCAQKVQQSQVRAVCAYAVGLIAEPDPGATRVARVHCDPRARADFHDAATGQPITHADRVGFSSVRAYLLAQPASPTSAARDAADLDSGCRGCRGCTTDPHECPQRSKDDVLFGADPAGAGRDLR
ncbi:hypothetical protein [Actinokineospora iranica]|uniref:Uncharacterized protein n=1 Tax=Actinokineospora iranica TaxID=1271860 RepID=A0A1G6VQ10_9PSEU|nr:hypothetical protein [Actinokineospora iranica]SDD55624.1 hypothetical protein SAMN05216174_11332 [Actinokineospora iranica]